MSETRFRKEVFTVDNPVGLACMVASMGSKIVQFAQPAEKLNALGYDVAVYAYDRSVFVSGEPELLPSLITAMSADFEDLGSAYNKKLYCGASGGSFIGFNMQRRAEGSQHGVYATAGVPISEAIYHSPGFHVFRAAKAYAKRGYDESRLREAWKDIEMSVDNPPLSDKSIVVVLGGLDYFVNYAKARSNLAKWQEAGVPITIKTKPHLSHSGTIKWFKSHIDKLVREGDT